MAYDEALAEKIRNTLGRRRGISEKKMFGGLAFLIHGNMVIAASGQGGLLVRVDPASASKLLALRGVKPMVMRGKEMPGWLRVDSTGMSIKEVSVWAKRGVSYAEQLPAKARK